MKKRLFSLFLFLPVLMLANDYSFFITGDLQIEKMVLPNHAYSLAQVLPFYPEKRLYSVQNERQSYQIKEKETMDYENIIYNGRKKIQLIEIENRISEKIEEDTLFFSSDEIDFIIKDRSFQMINRNDDRLPIEFKKTKEMSLYEIKYEKKARNFILNKPPEIDRVGFSRKNRFFGEELVFLPEKDSAESVHTVYPGIEQTDGYYLGYTDDVLEVKISNGVNRLFISNGSGFAGAEFSENYLFTEAYFPDFSYQASLKDDFFLLDIKKTDFPFEYGLGMINSLPLPLLKWYSEDFGGSLSLGCDLIDNYSYGVDFRIKSLPYSFGIASGYNFKQDCFHVLLSGTYQLNNLFLQTEIQYSYQWKMQFGCDYYVINTDPWFLKIYGNIGYSDFPSHQSGENKFGDNINILLGTNIEYDSYNLDFNVDYNNGGLKFNVEAGYTF